MGKYAKIALVLLYVAQLAVLFKDQLTSLYKHALETVQREASQALHRRDEAHASGPEKEPLFFKRAADLKFDPKAALFAWPHVPALVAMAGTHHSGSNEHEPHPAHDDDKHKDRPKKRHERLRVLGEIMFRNLYPEIRALTAHPSSREPREQAVVCAVLRPDALSA